MSIIKLKNAGEEAVLAVASAEIEAGQYGEQVKFTTKDGDVMWVPLGSVVRQLDRCKVANVEDLAGKSVHFFRAPNSKAGSAPFWNIDLATNGETAKTNGKPVVAQALSQNEHYVGTLPGDEVETGGPPTSASGFDTVVEKYGECFTEAAGFAQRIHKMGIPVDLSGVSAIAATLFIARKDARV